MKMKKVTWGVMGCSDFARRRTIPAMLEAPAVELAGIASRSHEKAESFRSQFGLKRAYRGYDELLEDPGIEAVYVPLPNGLHAEWMIRAAEAGKHCLCEKPFTTSAAEAVRVRDAFARRERYAMEAFMWRFHAQHTSARRAVAKGDIGPVRQICASFSFRLTRRHDVRWKPELGGGSLLDVGCYPISAARYYFDDEPVSAFATAVLHQEDGVDLDASGVLRFRQGTAVFDSSFRLPYRTHLEITGENGIISIPKPWLPDHEAVWSLNDEILAMPVENQYVTMFEHFSQSVLRAQPPSYGPDDAVRQMRVIDAVFRSIQSGRSEPIESENP
jgi:xylose dehydrogenase (NAD/NADP)